jgi:hypothetical protein
MLDGGDCSQQEITDVFKSWTERMEKNKTARDKGEALVGFLLPLEDERKSLTRLG